MPEPASPVRARRRARRRPRSSGCAFEYVEGRPVLPGLDLDDPGRARPLALVGTTGAGKTTIAKLLSRFYDPTAGRVTLDGVDLRDLDEPTLRRAVVMVTQENYMFGGTRRRQHPVRPARGDRWRRSWPRPQAIGAHEFISRLPQGYDTDVANKGGRLSAGQRQLVAFAPGVPRRPGRADPRRGDVARSTYPPSGWCSAPCARSWPTGPR